MSKKDDAGFKLTGVIKRSDFAFAPQAGSAMLSDEVTIMLMENLPRQIIKAKNMRRTTASLAVLHYYFI